MTAPTDNTPASIIADAYLEAGLIQLGVTPNSDQIVLGMRRLTDLINIAQITGIKLWLNVDTTVPLVEDQGTYVLSPTGDVVMVKPLRVIEAYYLDENDIRRPLVPLSWDDYIRLSQVTQSGAINSYFVNKKQTELSVFFWLIPDETAATGEAHLLLQTQVTNFTNVVETMNFPIEWRSYLHWGLAAELSTGQPQTIVERCEGKAALYKELLENWDVEDTPTRFTPDPQMIGFGGAFR